MKKITLLLILMIFTAFLLISCENSETPPENDKEETKNEETIKQDDEEIKEDTAEDEENTENTGETDEIEDNTPKFYNKLTGLETTEEISNIRPVGIMINNVKQAIPQQGISNADVIYEILAEGGITRLFCLFTEYASLPETGSIRSSRDYYIDIANAHDAIYVHFGGSPAAYETLSARRTDNMDGISFDTPFYRSEWRKKNMGTEHSAMTTGEKLVEGIEKKGYRTTSDARQPFSFNTEDAPFDGEKAEYIKAKFSYYATSEFDYDSENKVYLKSQYGEAHIDSNNDEQLSFKNIIILYCPQGLVPGDDKGRLYVNFYGTGKGFFASDGAIRNITWSKASRTSDYTLYEEDGETELLLNPGKTYVAIFPTGGELSYE